MLDDQVLILVYESVDGPFDLSSKWDLTSILTAREVISAPEGD